MDYIKRVVGLPGDRVEYRTRSLTINARSARRSDPRGRQLPVSGSPVLLAEIRREARRVEHSDADRARRAEHTRRCSPSHGREMHLRSCGRALRGAAGHYFVMATIGRQQRQPLVGLRAGPEHRRRAFFIWFNFGGNEADRRLRLRGDEEALNAGSAFGVLVAASSRRSCSSSAMKVPVE